jgi:hypothetical protein
VVTFDELIAPFGVRGKNLRLFALAHQECPDGFAYVCEEVRCRGGVVNPAGLLFTKIIVRREHLEVELEAAGQTRLEHEVHDNREPPKGALPVHASPHWTASAMSEDDRRHLDEYDFEANLETNCARARELFELFVAGSSRPANERAGVGKCGECGNDSPWRETWGTFKVCAGCASRRHLAALRVAAEVVQAEAAA